MTSATSTPDLLEEADLHCDAVCLQVEIPDGRLEEEDRASRSVLRTYWKRLTSTVMPCVSKSKYRME